MVCSSVPPVAALTAVITPHSGGCNAGSGVSGEWLNEKMGGTGIGTKGSRLDSSAWMVGARSGGMCASTRWSFSDSLPVEGDGSE